MSKRPQRSCRKRAVVVESDDERPRRGKQRSDNNSHKWKREPPTAVPLLMPREICDGDRRKRVQILLETIRFLDEHEQQCQTQACRNLVRWLERAAAASTSSSAYTGMRVLLIADDMLETAGKLTKECGTVFAVLNMANAVHPGGGFTTGAAAQEENMLRRTNIVKTFGSPGVLKWHGDSKVVYSNAMTRLLNATAGCVYCDHPRPWPSVSDVHICVRGRENHNDDDLGYRFLKAAEIFPFYELRSAAVNVNSASGQNQAAQRGGVERTMEQRIVAQLDTLISRKIRHVVLSAFGCGAFGNDPRVVATIYARLLQQPPYTSSFDVVAFSIFYAGHGQNNAFHFQEAFKEQQLGFESYSGGYPTTSDV